MLKRLVISNYALIKHLDIPFYEGFSTITGETGAGKSIMLDALGLVLGNRADTMILWDKDSKCSVEATFAIKNYGLESLFGHFDLDYDDETLFRREINPAGKSRAFINDTPVTLQVLREIGARLINIHSQHEILVLNNRDFQLAMLDSFAGIESAVVHYQSRFNEWRGLNLQLQELRDAYADQLARHDYDSFLFDELMAAKIDGVDFETLEQECNLLENAEEIQVCLHQLNSLLTEEPADMLSHLRGVISNLQKLGSGSDLNTFIERLNSLFIEAEDLQRETLRLQDTFASDQPQLESLRERINHLNHLFQKHRVSSVVELVDIRNHLDVSLQEQISTEDAIKKVEKECIVILDVLRKLAEELSIKRANAAKPLASHLMSILSRLGMPDGLIELDIERVTEPLQDGYDKVTLLFSANKGSRPDMISKIASGGELSRLMLAVKSVLSSKKLMPSIIFDEIDSGVSGEIAGKTGNLMKEMGISMQVIAITHLPQIASKGTVQYLASKYVENGRTFSSVKILSDEERAYQIARMLSDKEPTRESMANAKQLLGHEVNEH